MSILSISDILELHASSSSRYIGIRNQLQCVRTHYPALLYLHLVVVYLPRFSELIKELADSSAVKQRHNTLRLYGMGNGMEHRKMSSTKLNFVKKITKKGDAIVRKFFMTTQRVNELKNEVFIRFEKVILYVTRYEFSLT